MSTIPATLHYCPQCWQELASGMTKDGVPRICKLCIVENVRVKAAFTSFRGGKSIERKTRNFLRTKDYPIKTRPWICTPYRLYSEN